MNTERCAESVRPLFIVVISLITGGCEMSGGRKICRQDDRGWYCWAAGQYGTLLEIVLESVYHHARGQTPGRWPLLAVNPSPVAYCSHCIGPRSTRVTENLGYFITSQVWGCAKNSSYEDLQSYITFDRPLLSITQSFFSNYWIFCILFIHADSNKLVYLICWTD